MKQLLHPRWILIFGTLPMLCLLAIYAGQYSVINTLLTPESKQLWGMFGISLALLACAHAGLGFYLIINNKKINIYYPLFSIPLNALMLFLYAWNVDKILPFDLPRWMLSDGFELTALSFLTPVLAHAFMAMVILLTPEDRPHRASRNFLAALAVPVSGYLFVTVLSRLHLEENGLFFKGLLVLLFATGTMTFLFFLARWAYLLAMKRQNNGLFSEYPLLWRVPIGLVFPLLGLALNNGLLKLLPVEYVFGNFSSNWFYLLALVNGILFCLPPLDKPGYRLFRFLARCATAPFAFYFFVVFLPFLPFSVVAVIGFGLGFLMLTPLVLFIVQLMDLNDDYKYLSHHFSVQGISVAALFSIALMPGVITATYASDRRVLHVALDYLYAPEQVAGRHVNTRSLAKTLAVLKEHKRPQQNAGIFGNQTPYLSPFFAWMALDNLTVSNAKVDKLEQVFFGAPPTAIASIIEENRKDVILSDVTTSSTYDAETDSWRTWVELEMTNESNMGSMEYENSFELPEGCWISNYYLYIGERKEMGLLAEKKTALWVYSQIKNTRRDPGLLHYLTGRRVALHVFPFSGNEKRRTGIEFVHKEPLELHMDGQAIRLGKDGLQQPPLRFNSAGEGAVSYISTEGKSKLPKVQRSPYFHFIINASNGNNLNKNIIINNLNNFITKNPNAAKAARITLAGTYCETFDVDEGWQEHLQTSAFEGGFFLERALQMALAEAQNNKESRYPVLVVVGDNLNMAILDKDFSDWEFALPEGPFFHLLHDDGSYETHSLVGNMRDAMPEKLPLTGDNPVLAWPNAQTPFAYLPDDGQPSIALKTLDFGPDDQASTWQKGLYLQAKTMSHTIKLGSSDAEWKAAMRQSVESGIMTPETSYIALENEAQKAALQRKQKETLKAKQSLDLGEETPQPMSEPSILLLFLFFGLFVLLQKARQNA
jgi:hypothetical protein